VQVHPSPHCLADVSGPRRARTPPLTWLVAMGCASTGKDSRRP
jgi:hypothetical protein